MLSLFLSAFIKNAENHIMMNVFDTVLNLQVKQFLFLKNYILLMIEVIHFLVQRNTYLEVPMVF